MSLIDQTTSVFAPVSIGNISVGFDSLGLALRPIDNQLLGDLVSVETALINDFELTGSFANRLPQDRETNIVWTVLAAFNQAMDTRGFPTQQVKLTLHKNIPVCSGLGSSACSVVAAFVALNEYHQRPFDDHELLLMMGQAEAQISGSLHYDNVAPCYLGGMQLMLNAQQQVTTPLPVFKDVYWVLAYPDVIVSTQAARALLPAQYDRSTLIRFGQNLAGFVAACYQQDQALAFALLKDEIAEPYRAELLPNYDDTKKQLLTMNSMAVGISGSGPTLFSVCDDLATAQAQADWLKTNYLQTDQGFVAICQPDLEGTRKIG
ncbi:homoserine kinase [Marinicella sp. S1101]|uniref:homoserine kinase n=1 Tax=Marinicella marina TaxID=2996016 RepID=UPI002260E3D1|nr:homoserine kinase [Marinicella marina]MCX7552383.1 homoserine kinase [Marinicella marina]MDJ1139258.1 homoserine kinase [Marinicella marina]